MSSRRKQRYDEDYQEDDYSDSSDDGCCLCITRSFVFWCNVALLIFGLAAMGYAIYLWVTPDLEWAGDSLALKFTIFAAFLVIVALLGITGTWDEVERCDLVVYLILILSIVIAQIAFVIYAATNEDSLREYLEGIWEDWSDARKDQAMESYECGLYHDSSFNVTGESGVVINQDPVDITNCMNAAETLDYCFEDCYTEAKDAITTIGALTSTFLILFALLEFMLLISTFILVCNPVDYDDYSEEEQRRPQRSPQRRELAYQPRKPQDPRQQQYAPRRGSNMRTNAGERGRGIQMTRGQAY